MRDAERNVRRNERVRTDARDGRRVVRHHVDGDGNGAVEAEHDVPDGIADEDDVRVRRIGDARRRRIVSRDADDLSAMRAVAAS